MDLGISTNPTPELYTIKVTGEIDISNADSLRNAIDLENYVNMELLFMIGFGVAFELPLIIFYLSVFHIVSYAAFRGAWRYVYVGLLVGSAVITPDGSPVTLGLMYGALLSLYEISLAIARVVITAREGKEGLFVSRLDLFSDDEDDEE